MEATYSSKIFLRDKTKTKMNKRLWETQKKMVLDMSQNRLLSLSHEVHIYYDDYDKKIYFTKEPETFLMHMYNQTSIKGI